MKPYYIYFFVAFAITVVIYTSYRYYISDCNVSEWSEWTSCSSPCGGGTQQRYRSITKYKKLNGKECPPLTESRQCNTQNCPINCQVSNWSDWSECNVTCGGGTQIRNRTVTTPNMYGGEVCPVLTDTRQCNTQNCPIDCQVSEWSEWSTTCNATCGTGLITRSRVINVTNMYGGEVCPILVDTTNCKIKECPVDCIGKWIDVTGSTSSTCDKYQYYSIEREAKYGGVTCPYVNNFRRYVACPINCKGEWENLGECEVDDCRQSFDGLQTQNFKVSLQESSGGKCPNRNQSRRIPCNNYICLENYFINWTYSERIYSPTYEGINPKHRIVDKGTLIQNDDSTLTYEWKISPLSYGLETRKFTLSLIYNKLKNTLSYSFYNPINGGTYTGDLDRKLDKSSIYFTTPMNGNYKRDFKIIYDPIDCQGHWEKVTECNTTSEYSQNVQKFIIDVNATYGGKPCEYENGVTMTRTCIKSFESDVYYLTFLDDKEPWYQYIKASVKTTSSGNIIKKKFNTPNTVLLTFTKILDISTGNITYEYEIRPGNTWIQIDTSLANTKGIVKGTNGDTTPNFIYNLYPALKWDV